MPWYWSDDLARVLLAEGRIDAEAAAGMIRVPVAVRRQEADLETAARALQDDGEVPLAA